MLITTLKSKIEQATRLLYINTITASNGSVLIVEYPKSGGTWLGQLISNYLDLPFPRNRMPIARKSLFHSHYLPKWRIPNNPRIVYLVRDGRDVMVSLYFHQLIWNEKNKLNPKDVIYHRKQTGFKDFEDVKGNMLDFIHYTFTEQPSKLQHFTYMGNWATYNRSWIAQREQSDENIYLVRYEDLLLDAFGTMKDMFEGFFDIEAVDEEKLRQTVQKFSFENQAKRKKGQEDKNSFLRKGISGDWKNYFGPAEREAYNHYAGDVLQALGYEQDESWLRP
ncbi:Sulfotransferase domain-containing protein [Robiginitalea myxolifaciens]|uniref:Sulfotransferase domain-containing protein n=1 Tax=Robiginitalea myxolifaciens TaxID=400055 RepID=A0A1I6G2Q3_9FLAO|nr:sulfotransferase domain-containing protein [Robiginitalea myxolifaciens]SFR36411.1 Sulfotransferase domain-containing protein [Robiginitalea myxolifaciens]